VIERKCKLAECSKPFVPNRKDQIFHSVECCQKWWRQHYKEWRELGRQQEQQIEERQSA
jgi:hypothetical protein